MPEPTDNSIIIRGGRVIDPANGRDETADVLIVDGRVTAVASTQGELVVPDGTPSIDAEGCIVAPGLIDIHVHFRDPHPDQDEDMISGSASAVAGGFTTVCCMPNTTPAMDSPELVKHVTDQDASRFHCRTFAVPCGTVGRKGETPTDIGALIEAGAVGFTDDGDVIADPGVMKAVMQAIAPTGKVFMQHAQDPVMSAGGVMNAGPLATKLGLTGWPREAEETIVERDIELAGETGCRYHVQHVSSGGSVELIRRGRAAGLPVSGEASPHHLLLTEEACERYDTHAKMNPPLRTAADIRSLKEGIADGTIPLLATDHAPHPQRSKRTDFASAAFGIVGLECALPLYVRALVDDGVVDWARLIALMTIEPARMVGLDGQGLGTLAAGAPGDVTVIDPDHPWTIDSSTFLTTGRNCPFDGWNVGCRAVITVVGGQVRWSSVAARVTGLATPAGGV